MATGIVYGEVFLKHDTGRDHVERAARLIAVLKALKRTSLIEKARLRLIRPTIASLSKPLYVHSKELVDRIVEASSSTGYYYLDSDTVVSPGSLEAALASIGGALKAGDLVLGRRIRNAFCLNRPPGHHATRDKASGFCLFNNAAILAAYLLRDKGLRRVLIVDWDVHHGNGTQDIFYSTSSVLFFSIHQDGRTLYPGSGHFDEVGVGEGEGFNVNLPLPPGIGDDVYLEALQRVLPSVAKEYRPDFIIASVGFDAHYKDPLGGLNLSATGYYQVASLVANLASELCEGRLICVLEGGYSLRHTARCAVNTIAALANHPPPFNEASTKTPPAVRGYVERLLSRLTSFLSKYWPSLK
ncbi:MAG: histone deacetylase [Candidatus Nezhaarchaeota archaeon]|nr:histone deacetylase [Candidatus Nezhaarchaeota archaeon]